MNKDKESIGKIGIAKPLTKKELMDRAYKRKWRELKIAKMRASVLKIQITRAYEILESVRFDFLSDTMFRDYFTEAKKQLEGAMSDFLLSDSYWEQSIKEHRGMTPEEFSKQLKHQPIGEQSK